MLVQLSGGACTTVPRTWLSRQGWAAKTLTPGLSSTPVTKEVATCMKPRLLSQFFRHLSRVSLAGLSCGALCEPDFLMAAETIPSSQGNVTYPLCRRTN